MRSITKAANLLQTSEYKIFSEAYLHWYGDRPDDDQLAELFSRFMMFGDMPDWADKFARNLLSEFSNNRKINLNSYCLLNMAPRIGARIRVSFSIVR